MRLSLAMIVKNEAEVLGRVLSQAQAFCDELVVVDTGSTDDTVAIAESFGARVAHFAWIDDFAAARNHAFDQCTGDWIIWLDADDVIPEETQRKILALKNETIPEGVDSITCSYEIAFAPDGRCTISIPRERIIRRASAGRWQFPIHESFVQPENSYYLTRLDIRIEHRKPAVYTERSVSRNLLMLERLLEKGDRSARNLYYYGKELQAHDRHEEAISAFKEHLAANPNNDASRYQALHYMTQCAIELGRESDAIHWALEAVEADASRAEAYMALGVLYYRKQAFAKAVPLLLAATGCRKPTLGGSIQEADYSWKPYHYLSLCYEGLGEFQKAIEAALKAFPTIPDKEVIIRNIQCFTGKLK